MQFAARVVIVDRSQQCRGQDEARIGEQGRQRPAQCGDHRFLGGMPDGGVEGGDQAGLAGEIHAQAEPE